MSKVYDSWEKLVGAVLNREELRRLALCDSFSSISTDFTSRFSLDSTPEVSSSSGNKLEHSSQNILFCPNNVMVIECDEIRKATKNFRHDMLLWEEGSGSVYRGWMDEQFCRAGNPRSGTAVAVKRLNNEGKQGHKEWAVEINYLGRIGHPNLVKLIGYSFHISNRFLVYEFMPKGSLDNHLFRRRHESLPWATRIKVAVGAARALAFLHGLETPTVYGGVKSEDILLDGEFNAKLWDFGLERQGHFGQGHFGVTSQYDPYAAPEYIATGHLSAECDVYSFGVVLVELISGLPSFERSRAAGKHYLMDWVKPYLGDKKRLLQIVDSTLKSNYPHQEAYEVGKIAFRCVSLDPTSRPTMAEVVAALQLLYI